MLTDLIISSCMLFIFLIGVNGSVKLLQIKLLAFGYSNIERLQVFILYGIGQLISALIFNFMLKKTGFFRLFTAAALTIAMVILLHLLTFNILSLQLLSPILACAQSISFLCLVELLAPVMNNKVQGSFSILNQIVRAFSLFTPALSVLVEKLNIYFVIMIIAGVILFLSLDINVLLRDHKLTANVSFVYREHNSFFWSCFFYKTAEIIFSTFFILGLKSINYNSHQCLVYAFAPFVGRVVFIVISNMTQTLYNNLSFFLYFCFLIFLGTLYYFQLFIHQEVLLFIILFFYGGFLGINRAFLTLILKNNVSNQQTRFSISQTQYHIEFSASVIGYILGTISLSKGIQGIVILSFCNHLISSFFMYFS